MKIVFILFLAQFLYASEINQYVVDGFSKDVESSGIPKDWKLLDFRKVPKKTQYSVVKEGTNFIVKAVSHGAASGIYKEVQVNLKETPIVSWQWKVENVLQKSDATKKGGDDYSARIYVAFEYDPSQASVFEKAKYGAVKLAYGLYPPKGALNYVWDNKLPKGKSFDNVYSNRTKMVVIESGQGNIGRWIYEERNVYEDYKNLFGSEPPRVAFVALMTDTDNTGESAIAYYDDIIFKRD